MGALLAMPTMAQDEDVTTYIDNAGFDIDLTWQVNGAKKEIIDQSTVLSERSIAGIAADSSVYALVNPSTPKKRSDGRTLEATNGFIGRVQGWTVETNQDFPKCEWVYFGTVPYDLAAQAIPIADDGSTYLETPQRPSAYSDTDNIGFAYLRAGWGGRAVYKQTVKLPCAVYRLEYWAININPNGKNGKNLSKVTCRKDTWEDETGFNDTEWTLHSIEFTPTSEFSMQFGFESSGGSGSNPYLCIDGIRLYKIGEADPMEVLQSDINDLADECNQLSGQASASGFEGLAAQLGDYSMDLEEFSADTPEEMQAFITLANAKMEQFRLAIAEMEKVDAILSKMDYLLQTTSYAGKADLEAAYQRILGYKEQEQEIGVDVAALILGAVAEAKEAIKAYYLSQIPNASEDNPADFTFLIQHPWFIDEDAEPTFMDGLWVFPKQFDEETGEDLYKEGSASSPNLNSEGWYIAGASGGDQRLNWQRGRSCWNAWNSNFTTTLAVAQNISNLPNGYYTVSADLITQSGYANETQHAFAQSIAGKGISPALTSDDYDNNVWETLTMTTDQKVLVADGNLTIGAEGTGDGNASAGWFLATNFHLYYLGEASDADIAAALKNSFDASLAEAKELAAIMHFAGDKKALNDTIAKYEVAADKDAYIASIEALKAAISEAQKSEAKYTEYIPSQEEIDENPELISSKTLLWVKELLNDNAVDEHDLFSPDTKPIAQFAYDYVMGYAACDTATYTKFDDTVNLLKNYINTYIPVYDDAFDMADMAGENGKQALLALLNKQKTALTTEMKDKETVDAYVSELKAMMTKIEKQNIYDNPNATDYTVFIENPNLEAESGWNFSKGNGNTNTTSGQWYTGDGNVRYIDSYNSSGLVNYIATQLISDLPNGTYNVGVYTRTPAEGAYILYAVESDTTFVEIPMNYHNTVTEEGEDTVVVASDCYGPIWEEAAVAYEAGNYTSEQESIYYANDGKGRGWQHQEMTGIEVKNHELLIGTMSGTEASKTEKVFAGNWYSVGGWTLTLVSLGDNTGWGGPIESGIATILVNNSLTDGIYTLSGVKTNKLQRGVNIIITNGNVRKVMVK